MACICASVCSCNSVCPANVAACPANDSGYNLTIGSQGNPILQSHINNLYTAIYGDISSTLRRRKYWATSNPVFPTLVAGSSLAEAAHFNAAVAVINDTERPTRSYGFTNYLSVYTALAYGTSNVSSSTPLTFSQINNLKTSVVNLLRDCVCFSNTCPCNSVCACNGECACYGYSDARLKYDIIYI